MTTEDTAAANAPSTVDANGEAAPASNENPAAEAAAVAETEGATAAGEAEDVPAPTPGASPAPVSTPDGAPIGATGDDLVASLVAEEKFAEAAAALDEEINALTELDAAREKILKVIDLRENALADPEGAARAFARYSEQFERPIELERARAELLARTSREQSALGVLEELAERLDDGPERAELWERMGDLAQAGEGRDPQRALVHYQAAFRVERERASAIRKAAQLYLDDGRFEQAKQLVDLEREIHLEGEAVEAVDEGLREELGRLYTRIASSLLTRPSSHPLARQALSSALTLAPGLDVAEKTLAELDAFPTTWKDFVRKLRDEALDARDKREAAKRYLAIAEIYRAYSPDGPELEQNVDKCLLLAPGYRPALKFLEAVYREDDRLAEFVTRLRKQVKTVRTVEVAVDMWLFIAVLMAESGATSEQMAEAYEEVRRVDPRNMAAISALTELHMEAGRYPEAAAVMEEFLAEASDVGAKRSVLRTLARLYEVELDDLPKAKQRLESLRALSDDDDDLLLQLADVYERMGDLVMLANTLESLRERPGADHYQEKGRERLLERLLELYSGPLEAPLQAFDVARALFVTAPRDSLETQLMDLAAELSREADLGLTLSAAASTSADASQARRLRLKAADTFLAAGDRARARSVLDEVLATSPQDRDAQSRLDQLLLQGGDPSELAAALEARLQRQSEKEERISTLMLLADTYRKMRRYEDAITALREVLEQEPRHAEALEKLDDALKSAERFSELAVIVDTRLRMAMESGRVEVVRTLQGRLARLYDERLERGEDAAQLYLSLHEADPDDHAVLRALERLLERQVAQVRIAETLQPYYARVDAWRRHAEMVAVRRDHEESPQRRAMLSKSLAGIYEDRLRSSREAFDAWGAALLDEPASGEIVREMDRLSKEAGAEARFAEILSQAAEKLPDGPSKHALLSRRAGLLQGALGDQEQAIVAHEALLAKNPGHIPSLDALAQLYAQQERWDQAREMLSQRLAQSGDDEAAAVAVQLGAICLDRLDDQSRGVAALERAVFGANPVQGQERQDALGRLASTLRAQGEDADANSLVRILGELAECLAGAERAEVRAELGDVLRMRLQNAADALSAYEAALANAPDHPRASAGVSAIAFDDSAELRVRKTAGRLALTRTQAEGDAEQQAEVLSQLYEIEDDGRERRALLQQLVTVLVEDTDAPDEGINRLMAHLRSDPADQSARELLEKLAPAFGAQGDVQELYRSLRHIDDDKVALVYAARLADLCENDPDPAKAIDALEALVMRTPEVPTVHQRLLEAFQRTEDRAGIARCLGELARLSSGREKIARLLQLADYAFDSLEDAERGFDALKACRELAPDDDDILERMQMRLAERQRFEELAEIVSARAQIATSDSHRAALLLELGSLLLHRLDRPKEAAAALTEALGLERDGNSTARVTESLQFIAEREDEAGLLALDAIIDHHRAQQAWQPLVESLEIAANKRTSGDERARLFDEISQLQEQALRVPPLAFMAACRAFRDSPIQDRFERVLDLAEATQSFAELVAVLEHVADSLVEENPERAKELYAHIVDLATHRLNDREAQTRAAEAILRLEPGNREALTILESISRSGDDQDRLVAVLRRRAEGTAEPEERRRALLEMGQILVGKGDEAGAEAAFRQVVDEQQEHAGVEDREGLAALEALYDRTGNSAGHVHVLERLVAIEENPVARSHLRIRLGVLRLTRRGDPAGATDAMTDAVRDAPEDATVRAGLESLVDYARTHGAPPVSHACALLESVLRAQQDWASVPSVIETRLAAETDHASRAGMMLEVAVLQENQLGQKEVAFSTYCRAMKELPEDASIRDQAERLASATDNAESLALVYEDLLDEVQSSELRAHLNRRIATIAESVQGDPDEARRRLHAAVQAGAKDLETLQSLARLTRVSQNVDEHAAALMRLGEAAVLAGENEIAKESYAELADLDENRNHLPGAIKASREVMVLDPEDSVGRATLERLLVRAERWTELEAHLLESISAASNPEQQADIISRLVSVRVDRLQDASSAVEALEQLHLVYGASEAIVPLGARILTLLASDKREMAPTWRARVAMLLEPRYEESGQYAELVHALRLRLEVTPPGDARRALWVRVVDLYERVLRQPEQAFMAVGRALGEEPGDKSLRDKAELISGAIGDFETLIGLYEDITENLDPKDPLRTAYAIRCAELYEGGVGDPNQAVRFYEEAIGYAQQAGRPPEEIIPPLDRCERLYRAVGDPARLAHTLKRRADLVATDVDSDSEAATGTLEERRQMLFEAATIEMHGLQDFGAAIDTLKRLLDKSPRDLPALATLADACERQERWSDLADVLERELNALAGTAPDRALQVRFRLGVVLDEKLSLPDDAMAQFQAILEEDPHHEQTRTYLESRLTARDTLTFDNAAFLQASYEKTGDWQKAVEVMQTQVQELERRGDRQKAKLALLHIAEVQEKHLGMGGLAFMTFCRALKHDPQDQQIHEGLERLAIENETVDELCEVYEDESTAAEATGRGVVAADLRERAAGLCAAHLDDADRAIEIYEGILEKQPGRSGSLEALTALYTTHERFADLERILRRRLMFADEPHIRVQLLFPLAQVLADALDRPEDAIPLLEELRGIDATHVPARRLMIDLRAGTDELPRLRALLEEELQASREAEDLEGVAAARLRLAVLLSERMDAFDAAIPLWEEIRGEAPGDRPAFDALESLYTATENWEELRTLYQSDLESERDPNRISTLTEKLGRLLAERLGGEAEAIERHEKVLQLDPRSASSLGALRALYRQVERYDDLVAMLRRMMRFTTDPRELKDLRFDLADVVGVELGKRAEAVETGRRILDIEPHSADELLRLAAIFEHNQAFEELAGVLEQRAALLSGDEKVAVLLELAAVHEEKTERPSAAAPAYRAILDTDEEHEKAFDRLRELYGQMGEWQSLVELLDARQRLVADAQERVLLLKEIGTTYEERLGQKEMAFLAACRAYRENHNDDEVSAWMDRLAVETDSVEELIAVFEDALPHLSDEHRIIAVHLRMAELAWKELGETDDAETHLRRVLEYDAENTGALDQLTALYESMERWWDAVSILERKANASEDVNARIDGLRRIARVLDERAGDIDGAVSAYRRILELDGNNETALRELAELLERNERWSALIGVLERHEELADNPADGLAIRYRIAGIWESQLDNYDQAINVYQSILDDDSTYHLAQKALERLYTALDRPRELIRVYEMMIEGADEVGEKTKLLSKVATLWEESFEDEHQAVDANERILKIDPGHLNAVLNLERLLRQTEAWERLIAVMQQHIELSRDPAEIVKTYIAIGDVNYKELGRADKGEEFYNAALDFDPGSKGALHALGQLYERSGNWFNALEKLSQEAQLAGATPEAVEIYFRIGKINEEMLLDIGSATSAYNAALEIEPGHLPSLQALKEIAFAAKDNATYLKWLQAEAHYTEDEESRTELHTQAGLFLQDDLSDLDAAAEEFEKALAVTYDHLLAAKPLAEICYRNEQWERAEQLLDIIVERLDPQKDADELCRLHYKLGYICEKLGKDQKALKQYQRAYDLDSTYLPALELLGAALNRAERWDDAAKIYQSILIHHRDSLTDAEIVDYYQQTASLNQKMGQLDKAQKHLDKALEIDHVHAPSLRLLASVYEAEGQFEDAYEVLIRLAPLLYGDDRVALLVEIGRLAKGELDDPYRAIDAYEDANRQKAGDSEILEALLSLYRESRQGARAVEILEELVRVEPDEQARVRLNQMLGEVYRDELKNEGRAISYFNAALDLDPRFVKAFEAIEGLLSSTKNWPLLEQNYIAMLQRCPPDMEQVKNVIWRNLGDLYRFRLKNLEGAAQAYTVLHKTEPNDVEILEILADLLARIPARVDEAIVAYQKLLPLSGNKPQRILHELLRLYLNRKQSDLAFNVCAALYALRDLQPEEQKLYEHYARQQPPKATRALTDKLWSALLTHPNANDPVGELSAILWRSAGSLLARQPKELGLDKKRQWTRIEIDAPVTTYFFTHALKQVKDIFGIPSLVLYIKRGGADPMQLMLLDRPTLAVGEANEVFREMPQRQLFFLIGRQLAYLRPGFVLPRTLGAAGFQALVEAAIRLVEPRYPAQADPSMVQHFERTLAKGGPQLVAAIRPSVTKLLAKGKTVALKPFLEGMEHTAIRSGHTLAGDVSLVMQLLRQPYTGAIALPYGDATRELLSFVTSPANHELRQRLGLAIA